MGKKFIFLFAMCILFAFAFITGCKVNENDVPQSIISNPVREKRSEEPSCRERV